MSSKNKNKNTTTTTTVVYQCLNNHPADRHNGNCQVDGCFYGPNPKPKSNRK